MGGKEITREKLLHAAYDVMRERGFAGATSREIAARAGVSEGSIWVHFGSKYNLCLAVLAEPFTEPALLAELKNQTGVRAPREVLLELAEWMVAGTVRYWEIYSGALQHPETREPLQTYVRANQLAQKMLETISRYVEAEQLLGNIPDTYSPMLFTHLLIGPLFYHAQQVLMYGEDGVVSPAGAGFPATLVDALLES